LAFLKTRQDRSNKAIPFWGRPSSRARSLSFGMRRCKAAASRIPGHNVIYHEFAHKLDMLDGAADGTPPLRDRAEYRDWVQTCEKEYLRLKHDTDRGKKRFSMLTGPPMKLNFRSSHGAIL
jgi:hypothetical protein